MWESLCKLWADLHIQSARNSLLPRYGSQLELELEETRSTPNLGGGVDSRP